MDILQVRELKQSLERRDARILELEQQLEAARQPQERGEAVAWGVIATLSRTWSRMAALLMRAAVRTACTPAPQ